GQEPGEGKTSALRRTLRPVMNGAFAGTKVIVNPWEESDNNATGHQEDNNKLVVLGTNAFVSAVKGQEFATFRGVGVAFHEIGHLASLNGALAGRSRLGSF